MPNLKAAWLLAVLCTCAQAQSQLGDPATPASQPLWGALSPGTTGVCTGVELLDALKNNTGDIALANPIMMTSADWSRFSLPINITNNSTIRIHSGKPGMQFMIDWGGALQLLHIGPGSTLILDSVESQHPGNRTLGVEQLSVEIKGSPLWPTVIGDDGHKVTLTNSKANMDTSNCNPDFVQVEVDRFHKLLNSTETVQYVGGVSIFYVFIPFPAPLINILTKQQIGIARYTLANSTTTCYDSRYVPPSHHGGVKPWVWAVVGTAIGLLLLATIVATLLWRRHKRQKAALQAELNEERMSKADSADELGRLGHSGHSRGSVSHDKDKDKTSTHNPKLSSHPSRQTSTQPSGELHSAFMATRFGAIDGVQLGELLGRGAFGRVYKGRWKGAMVAVKVIDHRVQPGKTYDLSREPLLSMSVSHPNVCITHRICVVRISGGSGQGASEQSGSGSGSSRHLSSGSGSGSGGSGDARGVGSGGKLVPALGGGSGMVEVISPHDVLQPGMYETWLIVEYCDRGSLSDLLSSTGGRLCPDPAQQDIWILLCLLDVSLGLEYLHSSSIVHGDLKPANVLLKGARNDRRGFTCKLGDFGLSRMLGQEQTHVDTQSYGTASYAAPELLSQGKLSAAADIYSFAVIIWEMVSGGQELYPGLGVMQVILAVSQHKTRPDIPDSCPQALQSLMERCWSHDPASRPTAAQVVEDLRQQLMATRPANTQPARPST